MEKELNNKIIAITGGAEGIGFQIAKSYLKNKVQMVIVLDINEDQGNKTQEKLNTEFGPKKAVFIKCNVVEDLDKVFENICDQFGKVDVLINSAGIVNEEDPGKCVDVNLTATIKWSLNFLEYMKKGNGGNGGTIVNLASILGYRPTHFAPVYGATKFGVIGFTKCLGHKTRYDESGVRVIGICPGFTRTSMVKGLEEDQSELAKEVRNSYQWQSSEDVGEKAVEVFEIADSGTIWEIEGGVMREIK